MAVWQGRKYAYLYYYQKRSFLRINFFSVNMNRSTGAYRLFTFMKKIFLWGPTSQNGQTLSNNLSPSADDFFECVWLSCGDGAKRVKKKTSSFVQCVFLCCLIGTTSSSRVIYQTSGSFQIYCKYILKMFYLLVHQVHI